MWRPARISIPSGRARLSDRGRRLHSTRRTVERREETVAHRLDLATAVPGDLAPHHLVVALPDLAPLAIAEGSDCEVESTMSVKSTVANVRSNEDSSSPTLARKRPSHTIWSAPSYQWRESPPSYSASSAPVMWSAT